MNILLDDYDKEIENNLQKCLNKIKKMIQYNYNLNYINLDYKGGICMFIGREKELQFLNDRYRSNKAELIVLYGRRRVGKTETLKEFCKDKNHVFYSCKECTDREQLQSFSRVILQKEIPASKYIKSFEDWEDLFRSILEFDKKTKRLLVIDEFPYMVKNNKAIPSILQNLWDNILKDKNVMIILCGSSMSFIEKEILAEKNPLYGRATGIYKMTQMDFYDAIKFFPNYSMEDKIYAYSILGGIPHYLKEFDDSRTIKRNIEENILKKGCILYNEVDFLLHQELRETTLYNTIIEAIALGNTKLNDIYMKTNIEKTKIIVYLTNLMELEIIEREFSVDDGTKEQANVQRGLYKLTDSFFKFWYAYVFPNLSALELGDAKGVYELYIKDSLNHFSADAFEDICIQYLNVLNIKNVLPFRFKKIGRWWNSKDEIDIMASDEQHLLLGECKFKNSKISISDYNNLKQKYNSNKEIYYYMFSKSDFDTDLLELAKNKSEKLELISLPMLVPRRDGSVGNDKVRSKESPKKSKVE